MFLIQGLEMPSHIPDFILDFEPLLLQVVQVVRHKQESVCRLERRVKVMSEDQSPVSKYQYQVAELEEIPRPNIDWQL